MAELRAMFGRTIGGEQSSHGNSVRGGVRQVSVTGSIRAAKGELVLYHEEYARSSFMVATVVDGPPEFNRYKLQTRNESTFWTAATNIDARMADASTVEFIEEGKSPDALSNLMNGFETLREYRAAGSA